MKINKNTSENLKILSIPYNVLYEILTGSCIINDIPDYCLIIEIRENFETRMLDILIEHPSFSSTKLGESIEKIPYSINKIDGERTYKKLRVKL
jgi:hypothetical protein